MWRQPCTQRALLRLLPSAGRLISSFGVVPVEVGARRSFSDVGAVVRHSSVLNAKISNLESAALGRSLSTKAAISENQGRKSISEVQGRKVISGSRGRKGLHRGKKGFREPIPPLNLDGVTSPGQAQQIMCRRETITSEDFDKLIETARPGTERDAVVIMYCLKHMKLYKGLIITVDTADKAVLKMLDCLVGGDDVVTATKRVEAATMILKNFDVESGLFYTLRPATIDKVLSLLWEGVRDGGVETTTDEQQEENHPLIILLRNVIRQLNYRRYRPYREMKKRAARKYKRHIRIHSGTNPETVHLAVQIALHVASVDTTQKMIFNRCVKSKCILLDETIQLIETKKAEQDEASPPDLPETNEEPENSDESTPENEKTNPSN